MFSYLNSGYVQAMFLFLLVTLLGALAIYRRKSARALLPPGPPGHWLFGTKVPRPHSYRTFSKWTAQYGPIFSVRFGRELIIVIGTHQAALDIMEKENASLVDRPRNIAAGEILSGNKRILLMGSGDRFKKLRRALQSQLASKRAEEYEPIQTRAARNVILDILDNPGQHQNHAMRYAASVIMSITYGKTTPTSYSDKEIQGVHRALTRLTRALRPGSYMVNSFPILRYIPGYLSELKAFHQEELALFCGQFEEVRKKMGKDGAWPSFAKFLIEKQQEYDLNDEELAYLAGSMFGAGSDTTAAAISIVVIAAATHPESQRRVQAQLDLVLGRDTMPTFADQEQLTEVTAFMLESFRWRPVSAGGFAHRATKDIRYGPYCIPAGATVIGNHWAIGRDPVVFPAPDSFRPSRWLNEKGRINNEMKSFNFGFGRRVCPGQHVANRSIFINTALLLWAFKITEDPSSPIDTLAFTDTANIHPLPFRVKFEPRNANLREIVESGEM